MAQIKEIDRVFEDKETGFKSLIWFETRNGRLDHIEIQITVNGFGIAWCVSNHSLVRVMEGGKFNSYWEVLRVFLRHEYFEEIENIVKSFKS